ncbi:hypothetical protein RUND412_006608 [Rhizina undulata]
MHLTPVSDNGNLEVPFLDLNADNDCSIETVSDLKGLDNYLNDFTIQILETPPSPRLTPQDHRIEIDDVDDIPFRDLNESNVWQLKNDNDVSETQSNMDEHPRLEEVASSGTFK